jgi:hypothetical protein
MNEIETPALSGLLDIISSYKFAETSRMANFPREILEILMPQKKCLEFSLMRQKKDWGVHYKKWNKRNATPQVVLKIHL